MKIFKLFGIALLLGSSFIIHAGTKKFVNELSYPITVKLRYRINPTSPSPKEKTSSATIQPGATGTIDYPTYEAESCTVHNQAGKVITEIKKGLNNNSIFTISLLDNQINVKMSSE